MLSPRPTAHLRSQISAFVSARQAEALRDYLRTLRNSDFRAAGIVMSEAKCWEQLDEAEFWHFFLILNVDNARAYLGTLLKATVARHKVQSLTFEGEYFGRFATETATDIDRRKALEALLPLLSAPEAVEQMLLSASCASVRRPLSSSCSVPSRKSMTTRTSSADLR